MLKYISKCSNIGKLMIIIGICVLIPILTIPFYPAESQYLLSFIIPSLLSIILGCLLCFCLKKNDDNERLEEHITLRRSSLTVLFAWFWAILIGSLPLIFGMKLSVIQGLFEAVSGWTTTGLSVVDVTKTPMVFLFHRSFMQYCGGLGLILMMIILVS